MPAARPLFLGALGVLAALALSGCDAGPGPTDAGPSTPISTDPSGRPEPTDVVTDQLGGPWRRSPTILDDSHIAIVSDACAAAAREKLGETEANLPTALVDARGEHFATVIMADDLNAIECLARFDEAATSATVDSVDRLSMTAVAPVDGTALSVASVVHEADRPGGRTIAIGRIGPAAESAKVGFDDNSVILGTDAEGWWSLWWQGSVRASSYAAVDTHDIAVGKRSRSRASARRGSGRRRGGWIRRPLRRQRSRRQSELSSSSRPASAGSARRAGSSRRRSSRPIPPSPSRSRSGVCPAPATASRTRRSRSS